MKKQHDTGEDQPYAKSGKGFGEKNRHLALGGVPKNLRVADASYAKE